MTFPPKRKIFKEVSRAAVLLFDLPYSIIALNNQKNPFLQFPILLLVILFPETAEFLSLRNLI